MSDFLQQIGSAAETSHVFLFFAIAAALWFALKLMPEAPEDMAAAKLRMEIAYREIEAAKNLTSIRSKDWWQRQPVPEAWDLRPWMRPHAITHRFRDAYAAAETAEDRSQVLRRIPLRELQGEIKRRYAGGDHIPLYPLPKLTAETVVRGFNDPDIVLIPEGDDIFTVRRGVPNTKGAPSP
jgi:hypothetical protein